MKFSNREDFKKDMIHYVELSDRSKDLSKLMDNAFDDGQRLSIYKQIVISIHEFDIHVKYMIAKYPEYYAQYQSQLDILLQDNDQYMILISNQINKLSKVSLN